MEGWLVLAAGLVIYVFVKARQALRRQEAVEAQRKAEDAALLQRHREEQQRYREQMVVLGEQSLDVFESTPKHLGAAGEYLDQAAVDFADGAFAPFWDSIERAAKRLGRFDEGVRRISENSSSYTELIKKYEDAPPDFPLAPQSVAKLRMATATTDRIKAMVREAQRNFQFATIYEQRKTNKILVAGFTNLAQALDRMTGQIAASIDHLTSSFDGMTSTFSESMRLIHARLGEIRDTSITHHNNLSTLASERSERERRVLEMLDNIQRGRRPFP